MSHSVAELYAETITTPSPMQFKGRMYYIVNEEETLKRELQAISDKWDKRLDDLRAGGWRKIRRVVVDKEYRNHKVVITLPVWLAVLLSFFGFIWRR